MVHWIYILECEDEYIYIGETTRLYRRFSEHQNGGGSVNTRCHSPQKLIGLYKVAENSSFLKYRDSILNNIFNKNIIRDWGEEEFDNLQVENHFTEIFLHLRSSSSTKNFLYEDGYWQKIRGGKYTKDTWKNPVLNIKSDAILDRPNCHCLVPAEVKISKDKTKIYFVCALKNIWSDFYNTTLEVGEPCEFFQLYTEDAIVRTKYHVAEKKITENWCKNIPITKKSFYPDPCIFCNTINYIPYYSWYELRRICQECILNRFEELKKKYDILSSCVITD
jgi:predicted GIY-YIG superfamily endonuclease